MNDGDVREIKVDENYGRGLIYGGRWFEDVDTNEVWRLVPPDFPFKGLWEPVLRDDSSHNPDLIK
jgi:hypothetical protein